MYVSLTSICFVQYCSSASFWFWCLSVSCIYREELYCLCFVSATPRQSLQAFLGYLGCTTGHREDIPGLMEIQTYKSTSCSCRQISLLLYLSVQLYSGGLIHSAAAPDKRCYFVVDPGWVFGSCVGYLCTLYLVVSLVGCVDPAQCICMQMLSDHVCFKILLQ